jgi:hypothetical protein
MRRVSVNIELDSDSADILVRSIESMVEVMEDLGVSIKRIEGHLLEISEILEGQDGTETEGD